MSDKQSKALQAASIISPFVIAVLSLLVGLLTTSINATNEKLDKIVVELVQVRERSTNTEDRLDRHENRHERNEDKYPKKK